MKIDYDVIVIGAGQAGLAMGHHLSNTNLTYLIIDKCKRIGDVWRERDMTLLFYLQHVLIVPFLDCGLKEIKTIIQLKMKLLITYPFMQRIFLYPYR
jgi:cation diffusion facilitator CzcD-associated flavoprotein CzcO